MARHHAKFMRATTLDIVTSCVIFAFLVFLTIMVTQPLAKARERRNDVRADGVRAVMAALLQWSNDDPASFVTWKETLQAQGNEKYVISFGASCDGSFSERCSDELVADTCIQFDALPDAYLAALPVDPVTKVLHGAYYISFSSTDVEIGACQAEQAEVILQTDLLR